MIKKKKTSMLKQIREWVREIAEILICPQKISLWMTINV